MHAGKNETHQQLFVKLLKLERHKIHLQVHFNQKKLVKSVRGREPNSNW